MSEEPDFFDDADECGECGGEGGYNSCPEDCCPNFYGEDACTNPVCWRRCSVCRGTGFIK